MLTSLSHAIFQGLYNEWKKRGNGASANLPAAYAHKPREQWKPLFYRIVQNEIRDWYRRARVKNIFLSFLPGRRQGQDRENEDPVQLLHDTEAPNPFSETKTSEAMKRLETVLAAFKAAAGLSAQSLGGPFGG
jgi:DNA-directed RNA polymerase specialized sigma24 family protein